MCEKGLTEGSNKLCPDDVTDHVDGLFSTDDGTNANSRQRTEPFPQVAPGHKGSDNGAEKSGCQNGDIGRVFCRERVEHCQHSRDHDIKLKSTN